MKFKMVYSLLFVTLLGSCNYNELTDTESPVSSSIEDVKCSDFRVNIETAKYAAKLLSDKDIKDIKPIVYHGKDTVLYVVNYDDGWTLLSADMRAKAVIASSQTGTFDETGSNSGSALWINNLANQVLELKHDNTPVSYSELNKNEEYVFWHRMYLGYLTEASANAVDNSSSHKSSMRRRPAPIETTGSIRKYYLCKKLVNMENVGSTTQVFGNRLKTKWGQMNPYNVYVPKVLNDNGKEVSAPVGCTAVAIGQILYYYHYKFGVPSSLNHGARYVGTIYNDDNNVKFIPGTEVKNSSRWDKMALYAGLFDFKTENTNYVAELFADLGNKLNMKYSFDGSSANTSIPVINQYGLNCDMGVFDANKVEQNIRNELPVIISSYAKEEKINNYVIYDDGHTWIIDGLSETTTTKQYNYLWVIAELRDNNDRGRNDSNEPSSPRGNHAYTEPDPFNGFFIVDGTYTSIADIYKNYECVIESDIALSTGCVPKDANETEIRNETQKYFMMNWGYYGNWNDILYSIKATNWEIGEYNFEYKSKIFYNFRKQ